jgi:CRP-like cAMP-binding protein
VNLADLQVFRGLLADEVARIVAAAERRTYAPGDLLFRENDPGGDLLLVEDGVIEVRVRGDGAEAHVVTVGPGEILGEVSMIDEGPRSADAVARTDTRALYWPRAALARVFEREPRLGYVVSANIGRIVATRIRGANALLLYATGKGPKPA